MRRFLITILFFSLPVVILVSSYFFTDVFKVIYHYDPYYDVNYPIGLNRSYGSTETFLNQNKKYHYNSFIFGNSRSLFYEVESWNKYLPKGSICFHFDASGGSIKDIYDKIKYLDEHGCDMRNALIVFDRELLACTTDIDGYLFAEPPKLNGYKNIIDFHVRHLTAYLKPQFLLSVLDYSLNHDFKPYMKDFINPIQMEYEPISNEIRKWETEKKIEDGQYYDDEHIAVFEGIQHPGSYSLVQLDDQGKEILMKIKGLLDKHDTDYRIVISPLYDQIKLNESVLFYLKEVFGNDRVFDFSGVNEWNKDFHNYYEDSHYRPHVAREIMNIVYAL